MIISQGWDFKITTDRILIALRSDQEIICLRHLILFMTPEWTLKIGKLSVHPNVIQETLQDHYV